jgi:rhodanese-related sulfurtransferase
MLPEPESTLEISAEAVAKWVALPADQRPRLIDCREADELTICQIEGNEWVPLGSFSSAGERLTADVARGIVVYCHHGMRSLRAAHFLRESGVANAFSMAGGVHAWAERIEPGMARY